MIHNFICLSRYIYLSLPIPLRQPTTWSTQVSRHAILQAPCSYLTRSKVNWKGSQASFHYTLICVPIPALHICTGPFVPLTACPFCGECWYEQHHDIVMKGIVMASKRWLWSFDTQRNLIDGFNDYRIHWKRDYVVYCSVLIVLR